MTKKIIMLTMLIIMAMLALSACRAEQAKPPDGGGQLGSERYGSLERLLAEMAFAKFAEANITGWVTSLYLQPIRELYMPHKVPEGFELVLIESFFTSNAPIAFGYAYRGNNRARAQFIWQRDRPTDEVRVRRHSSENNVISRAQHGYWFRTEFISHTDFIDQDLYDFSYAQPLIAWELQGNALSVSAQGMENVRIFDEDGDEIAIVPTVQDFGYAYLTDWSILRHHTLYRTAGDIRNITGYRWSIDEDLERWQYVLEPGTYTFVVEGAIHDEPGLLVRHFDDHEIVSMVGYGSAVLAGASGFTVTVTLTGSSLTIDG